MITINATATLNPGPLKALIAILSAPPVADVGLFTPEIATIGAYNEFGTATAPARSFLVSTANMYRRVYTTGLTSAVTVAIRTGKAATATKGVATVAQLYHRDIVRRINAGIRPANAPSTLARKQGTTPLIDTGAMKNAIAWRMR
jgi:hypothetical protein